MASASRMPGKREQDVHDAHHQRRRAARRSSPTPGRAACRAPTAMETAIRPTVSEIRAPWSTRLATSRPNWSLPSRKREPGGCSASRGAVLIGSRGLSHGAPSAISARVPRMRADHAPRWRASRRRAGAPRDAGAVAAAASATPTPDARIGEGVGHVDQHVDQHVGGGHEQHRALHEREVLGEDAADDEPAEARPAEDGLHDHGAGQQIAELQAEDRDHRDQRVLERVPHHDAPPRRAPWRARCARSPGPAPPACSSA